jgi:hypothetical protein
MNRIDFIESVSGIAYPEMLVKFFDYFIALQQLVNNQRTRISVYNSGINYIEFSLEFMTKSDVDMAINQINSYNNSIVIYDRLMSIKMEFLTDLKILITLS